MKLEENYSDYEVVSFAVDKKYIKGENFNNLPLIPFEEIENKYDPKNYFMHVALSYREFNKLREKKYISAKQKGFQLASFVSEQSNKTSLSKPSWKTSKLRSIPKVHLKHSL